MELLATVLLAAALSAGDGAVEPTPDARAAVVADTDRMTAHTFDVRSRFSNALPNERHRLYGADYAAKGDWGDALKQFRLAARYADKYSQHRISLMYWHGVGVPRDPALAYAWADLAAERLYPTFAILREKMWGELSEEQRQRALHEGEALYAQYGDWVAKPRLEKAMLRAKSRITGSRVGNLDGRLIVMANPSGLNGFDGAGSVDLAPMYDDWRLNPKRYWAAEDAIWKHGNVEVGPTTKADQDD